MTYLIPMCWFAFYLLGLGRFIKRVRLPRFLERRVRALALSRKVGPEWVVIDPWGDDTLYYTVGRFSVRQVGNGFEYYDPYDWDREAYPIHLSSLPRPIRCALALILGQPNTHGGGWGVFTDEAVPTRPTFITHGFC